MLRALLIAEKPSLMREIRKVYNRNIEEFDINITFLSQAGHLFTLKSPKEIDAEKYGKWELKDYPQLYPYYYKIGEGKEQLVQDIKEAINSNQYDFIIHAGDPDGEGQLLIDETLLLLRNTLPVKRFWQNDLTEESIINTLKNLKDNREYENIQKAALVRQHEDYQFGMNTTGIATLKMHELSPLGRVKAIIIYYIVKRELEIENYVEKRSYKPSFLYKGCEFVINQAYETAEEVKRTPPKNNQAKVIEVKEAIKKQKAPKLYRLATLQTMMSSTYHWSASKTLEILQKLYESKAVSYPRTDCEYISSAVDIQGIQESILKEGIIESRQLDRGLLKRSASEIQKDTTYCNDKAIATEGHTAIIPTGAGLYINATADERMLYEIICRRYLAIFAEAKEVKKTKVSAICDNYEEVYEYTESSDIKAGYEKVLDNTYKEKEASGISYQKDEILKPIEYKVKECVTTPPVRYTDGTLIKALDKAETLEEGGNKITYKIGTPATRDSIINGCMENGYFIKKGVSFVATDKAKTVVKLFGTIPLFNPIESGKWESLFDKIRQGEKSIQEVEEYLNERMIKSAQEMLKAKEVIGKATASAKALGKCPKCKSDVIVGKFGAFCSGKCGMTFSKAYGKDLTETQIKNLLLGKKILVKGLTSKKGTKYNAYLSPNGISEYSYNGKTGYGFKYEMEFEK